MEYIRNQELKIHLPMGSIYSYLIFSKCVDSRKSTLVKRLCTEDAVIKHITIATSTMKAKVIICCKHYSRDIFVKGLKIVKTFLLKV